MKVKNGFVSNSSSSSFVCIGICNASELINKGFDIEKETNGLFDMVDDELENGVIGISIFNMIKRCGGIPINNLYQYLADELNKTFDTTYKAKDFNYIEEVTYDG